MSLLLRADLVDRKKAVLLVLGQDVCKTETVAVRASKPRAVLIQSQKFGQVWVVPDLRLAHEIRAEEALRPEPRPVLLGGRRP